MTRYKFNYKARTLNGQVVKGTGIIQSYIADKFYLIEKAKENISVIFKHELEIIMVFKLTDLTTGRPVRNWAKPKMRKKYVMNIKSIETVRVEKPKPLVITKIRLEDKQCCPLRRKQIGTIKENVSQYVIRKRLERTVTKEEVIGRLWIS